jgi:hypothetical protein
MKRFMPEFVAVPLVVIVLGLLFVILWAADAGLGAWLAVGAVILVALLAGAVVAMRRPRGPVAGGEVSEAFDGGAPGVDDGVHRVLLVTDGVCTTNDLREVVVADRERATAVFVVAPAVSSRVARWTGDEHAYAAAEEHLEATVRALAGLDCEATGHVGSHDPLQAADDGLREFPADEVVFVLVGEHRTDWLEQGVVGRARDRYGVPVRQLEPAAHAGR